MKVLNIMLSRDLGGMQQVFLDYDKMLKHNGAEVINVTAVFADINKSITPNYMLPNIANWDFLSILYLKNIIKATKPNVIIAHGGRATKFCYYAKKHFIPMVGIIHSGKLKWVEKAEYIIALTESMRNKAQNAGIPTERLVVLPNVIDASLLPKRHCEASKMPRQSPSVQWEIASSTPFPRNDVPIVGAMARFVPKKAIDTFIKSLAILREKQISFKAIIGGTGGEEQNLKALVTKLLLEKEVKFIGWVKNKAEFFSSLDIFCMPSVEEPFGVVILEAMLYQKPIIAADSEGPKEIITHMENGLLVRKGSAEEMANVIEKLIKNPDLAKSLTKKAFLTVRERYDINVVGQKLIEFLKQIT